MKILAIQNRMGIGDTVIFLPFIKAISKKFNSPVSLLVKENSKADQFLNQTTYIDKIKASKPAPFENVGDTPINSSPVESPINMNESPDDFVAPLTDMPAYTDKDHTGRFNIFRRS